MAVGWAIRTHTLRSMITDHHNKYNNVKVWDIARITKMWDRDIEWANDIRKMALIDLFNLGLPQTINMLKKKKSKHPQCTIKWSTVKRGVPVPTRGGDNVTTEQASRHQELEEARNEFSLEAHVSPQEMSPC